MTEVIDLEAYGAEFRDDPYPVYARLRARGPVHRVRLPPPAYSEEVWLVVGYDEARSLLADPRLFKDYTRVDGFGFENHLMGRHMLVADPPDHTRLRRLVTREFTARRVEALVPRVRRITDDLLDAMVPLGRADLVEAFAFPLPMTVICELLGVPAIDRAAFRRMSHGIVAPAGRAEAERSVAELGSYLDELIADKRSGAAAEDLLTALIRTEAEDGDRLSGDELRAMAFLLLIAGHETTVHLIANAVVALLSHPGQLAALRADMSLLDAAVEEALRYDGPVEASTYRFATEDFEVGGVTVRAGDSVLVGLGAAGRDPGRFGGPDRFDIRRAGRGHLAFGHGIHHCLGAPLARVEARIALRGLLERCPRLALDGPPGPWTPGILVRGPRSVPLRW
ncbi:cytochrome P450 [Streptomyces uncialis]|uniref:cytochrome P450 family protein n=1 Tax=Streptomyces uncialis TaxID=1048205 RepID=UPI0038128308